MATDTQTVAQMIERTRRHLAGVEAAPLNVLAVGLGLTDTQMSVAYDLESIESGVYVSIDDEILYVWSTDDAATCVVSRGMLGTDPTTHLADAVIESPTRFPKPMIKDALQDEVRSWPDYVFRVTNDTHTLLQGSSIVDLGLDSDDVIQVLSVTAGPRDASLSYADRWSQQDYELHRLATIDGVESELALQIVGPYERVPRTLNVVLARPFVADTADDGDNVVTEWGVPRTALDIPPIGAAARLLLGAEAVRTEADTMVESRVAAEVPPQYLTQTALAFKRIRDKRLQEEGVRLRGRWPVRRT